MGWWSRVKRSWPVWVQGLAILAGAAGLGVVAFVVYLERTSVTPQFRGPEEVFVHGTIGTEFIPLHVLSVLPEIVPQHFQPNKAAGEDWVDHFGFVRHPDPKENHGLPVGFVVTNYQPASASPSPVKFVGLSCAACHSVRHRLETDAAPRPIIFGAGNAHMDLIPFFEAFRAALLLQEPNAAGRVKVEAGRPPGGPHRLDAIDLEESDLQYVLNMDRIERELRDRHGVRLGPIDRFVTGQWLSAFRAQAIKTLPKYDYPYWGWEPPYLGKADGRRPEYNLVGPGRTQPFKTLINGVLNLPINHNRGFSKIPAVFNEEQHVWSQFDGSIRDHVARSALAAMTAGATPDSLDQPELSHNIKAAAHHTRHLRGPTFAAYFGVQPDGERARRGAKVYDDHCSKCHGRPAPGGGWEYDPDRYSADGGVFDPDDPGPQHGRLVTTKVIGTDPERAHFRYGDIMPFQLWRRFTYKTELGHPYEEKGGYPVVNTLEFRREDIRYSGGYVNTPIDSVFARAPYLHNASVPTLAQLINLRKRPEVFYRGGRDPYDARDVGLLVGEKEDATHYYKFDTRLPGNSNAGHDYPWKYRGTGWDEGALLDLLEYLKTF
jgi:mono/diheme cytochrome c family protein